MLQVDRSIISRDMAHLRHRARENLKKHIHQTIPEEYQKACNTLNQVLRMTWSIVSKTDDEKTRLQALALINDVNKYRTELVTNGVIVNDSLRIIQSKMEHLNGKGKRLLRAIKVVKILKIMGCWKFPIGNQRNNQRPQTVSSSDMTSNRNRNRKKETYATVLLSECPEEHTKCTITYYKGRIKELCMCRCHEHARPSTTTIREPDPIVGIGALKDIH